MNQHGSQSWTHRGAQAVFPLALGLAVAALILAIANGETAAIAVYSLWLASLTIMIALRVWVVRTLRSVQGDPGRELLSIEPPPPARRWNIGTIGLTVFVFGYAAMLLSDVLFDGEPFQRRHVGQLAIVAGLLAILFGRPHPFGPFRGHRVVLAESGLLLQTDPPLVEISSSPGRTSSTSTGAPAPTAQSSSSTPADTPAAPPGPVPQLSSIELGPIDDDTRQQIDAVLRERLPPQTPEPTSPAPSHSSET